MRIEGTDTGTSSPTTLNDPTSGNAGYPTSVSPLMNFGDVDSATKDLGQTYFMNLPILAVLGGVNPELGITFHYYQEPKNALALHFLAPTSDR
jgi:hypothetical protein